MPHECEDPSDPDTKIRDFAYKEPIELASLPVDPNDGTGAGCEA